jgi:hypothetical protein
LPAIFYLMCGCVINTFCHEKSRHLALFRV